MTSEAQSKSNQLDSVEELQNQNENIDIFKTDQNIYGPRLYGNFKPTKIETNHKAIVQMKSSVNRNLKSKNPRTLASHGIKIPRHNKSCVESPS